MKSSLPPALEGTRIGLRDSTGAAVTCYHHDPAAVSAQTLVQSSAGTWAETSAKSAEASAATSAPSVRPLLLVHSVNAAASAAEVRPLYDHYRASRPVFALDLPGYGLSDRSDRVYSARLMTDAVLAVVAEIQRRHRAGPIDILGVSLGCEFVARAAQELPAAFGSVALVSPTGFNRTQPFYGAPGSHRGQPWLHRFFTRPAVSGRLFRLLTRRSVVRFFLQKTWGSKQIDEPMFEYAWLTAQQPGASHAPFYFVSGMLFSADVTRLYDALQMPVWMVHGVRGDFVDYRYQSAYAGRPNWTIESLPTGALPYFEVPQDFVSHYDVFMASSGRASVAAPA